MGVMYLTSPISLFPIISCSDGGMSPLILSGPVLVQHYLWSPLWLCFLVHILSQNILLYTPESVLTPHPHLSLFYLEHLLNFSAERNNTLYGCHTNTSLMLLYHQRANSSLRIASQQSDFPNCFPCVCPWGKGSLSYNSYHNPISLTITGR